MIFLFSGSPDEVKVWHGETDIATYSTDSGEWVVESSGEVYGLANMFDDEDSSSIWHNHIDNTNTVQTLTFNFLQARDLKNGILSYRLGRSYLKYLNLLRNLRLINLSW